MLKNGSLNIPVLTVVIPCWNGSAFLASLLDSIMNQTYKSWQCIVVDDQSTDESISILKDYNQKDERIKYTIRNRMPKGAQTCRNIGMELSEGSEYVIFFDSDDVIAPYCFEQRVAFMESHKELDFAIAPAKTFHGNDLYDKPCSIFGYPFFKEDAVKSFLYGPLPFVVWNNIYRRESLVRFGLTWDEKILSKQDSDYNIQAILSGMKFDYISNAKIDYFWRVTGNNGSITKKIKTKNHFDSHLYFVDKVYTSLKKTDATIYEKDFRYYLYNHLVLFINGRSKYHIQKILRHVSLQKCLSLKIKMKLFSYIPLYRMSVSFQGRIESVFFPEWHNFHKQRISYRQKETECIIDNLL